MRTSIALLAAVAALVGCGDATETQPTPVEPPSAAPAPAEAPAAPAAPAGPKVEQPNFVLELASPSDAVVGQAGALELTLTPRAGWHVNQDFPVSIEFRGGEPLGLAKRSLAKADAAEFAESRFRFAPAFTPTAAGPTRVEAHVRYAICTDETCLPQENDLALELTVR